MKHTKGPWILDQYQKGERTLRISKAHSTQIIAEVHLVGASMGNALDYSEAYANAELITAAPQLIERLEKIKERLEAWAEHHQLRIQKQAVESDEDINAKNNYLALINTIDLTLKKVQEEK